jgi:hypothetical protein
MLDICMHILDIAENSARAGADVIVLAVHEQTEENMLTIDILDNGRGMDKDTLIEAVNPFMTTKKNKKTGLGLSLMREAARSSGGDLTIDSQQGKGTAVHARFRLDHIDRQPLGNIAELVKVLIVSYPDIFFQIALFKDHSEFQWDTSCIDEMPGNPARSGRAAAERINNDFSLNPLSPDL